MDIRPVDSQGENAVEANSASIMYAMMEKGLVFTPKDRLDPVRENCIDRPFCCRDDCETEVAKELAGCLSECLSVCCGMSVTTFADPEGRVLAETSSPQIYRGSGGQQGRSYVADHWLHIPHHPDRLSK